MPGITKRRVLLVALLMVGLSGVHGGAVVSGAVFCDQCKDGRVSLFDYPLNGVKVAMLCPGSSGPAAQETTNMFGGYTMRFDGTPDLSACYAQVAPDSAAPCQASAGPPQPLQLAFSFFGMEFYSAEALISQPAEPAPLCSGSYPWRPPAVPVAGPAPPGPSACSHEYWMMPRYRCYWRGVRPDAKVGLIFGPLAALKYGGDVTLWAGLQGRADPYRTLLREAVTALLNSHTALHFPYTSPGVVQRFNVALLGSPRTALLTALRFKRANSGHTHGNATPSCKLKSCN